MGRVNVGKSRLFNRLVRDGRALVEDRPGVTRDRVVARTQIEQRDVLVVDTGGLDPDAEAGLPAAIRRQVIRVLEDAAVILFVVDVRQGLLPLDRQIGGLLHRGTAQVVVVANKADRPQDESAGAEFHALGFGEVVATSAEHGRGIADLEVRIAQRLPPPAAEAGPLENVALRLAIVGRPNVGKSSLVNCLLGEERVVVSDQPGTTRDATDSMLRVGDREVVLIDTAGLRRPGRRSDHLERGSAYMALRAIERADIALLLVDAGEGVTDQDARIARLALDCGRGLVLVLNKWDQVDDEARRRLDRQLDRKLAFVREPPILRVSARTGWRVDRVLPEALAFADSTRPDASTAQVNRVLEEAVRRNPPPMGGRRPARLYYATQVSARPFTVLIFVNDPSLIPNNYRKYLESFFRKRFGLRSAPLRLRLRRRSRRGDETEAPSRARREREAPEATR